jgi:hypothetical protein
VCRAAAVGQGGWQQHGLAALASPVGVRWFSSATLPDSRPPRCPTGRCDDLVAVEVDREAPSTLPGKELRHAMLAPGELSPLGSSGEIC